MKHSTYKFLLIFTSAYKTNKPYAIVPNIRAAKQLLNIFQDYGLILGYNKLNSSLERNFASGIHPTNYYRYLIVWFHNWPTHFSQQSQNFSCVAGRVNQSPSIKGPHQIKIMRKPSRKHLFFISHKKLKEKLPHFNILYILETHQGIITSEEALKFKIGGFILLAIYL